MSKEEKLNNLLTIRMEFGKAKQEYINCISDFLGDAVNYIHIKFYGNKMYVTFESFGAFSDKYLLNFCNEFGFLAPVIEFKELNKYLTVYKWEFIKILD